MISSYHPAMKSKYTFEVKAEILNLETVKRKQEVQEYPHNTQVHVRWNAQMNTYL